MYTNACLFIAVLVSLLPFSAAQSSFSRNVSVSIDLPQLIYTPFRCDLEQTTSSPSSCTGAWRTQREDGITRISTRGPDPAAGEVIPQLFFQFRGSALHLFTSPASNAPVNITATTNVNTTLSAIFDSRLGSASILNLPNSTVTTLALTYIIPDVNLTSNNGVVQQNIMDNPPVFELQSIIITTPIDVSTILPTITLPSTSSFPIYTPPPLTTSLTSPSSTPTAASASAVRRTNIALAVGITLGLGLGLTALVAGLFCLWRRRRRYQRTATEERELEITPMPMRQTTPGYGTHENRGRNNNARNQTLQESRRETTTSNTRFGRRDNEGWMVSQWH